MTMTTMYPGSVLADTTMGQIDSSGKASFTVNSIPGVVSSGIGEWALAFVRLDYEDEIIGSIDVVIPITKQNGLLTCKHDVFVSVGEGYTVTRVIISITSDYKGSITMAPYGGAGMKVSSVDLKFLATIY